MIKAIIFDYFGVLCSDEIWKAIKSDDRIGSEFKGWAQSMHTGEISWKDFVNKVARETRRTPQQVEALYKEESINLKLAGYIDELHQSYKTALLSNASQSFLGPMLHETHLDDLFDEIVVSSDLGVAKPDPKIFDHTLQKLGVSPEEAVFIDDLARHVDAAADLGIQGILYRDFGQMKQELEALVGGSGVQKECNGDDTISR